MFLNYNFKRLYNFLKRLNRKHEMFLNEDTEKLNNFLKT